MSEKEKLDLAVVRTLPEQVTFNSAWEYLVPTERVTSAREGQSRPGCPFTCSALLNSMGMLGARGEETDSTPETEVILNQDVVNQI